MFFNKNTAFLLMIFIVNPLRGDALINSLNYLTAQLRLLGSALSDGGMTVQGRKKPLYGRKKPTTKRCPIPQESDIPPYSDLPSEVLAEIIKNIIPQEISSGDVLINVISDFNNLRRTDRLFYDILRDEKNLKSLASVLAMSIQGPNIFSEDIYQSLNVVGAGASSGFLRITEAMVGSINQLKTAVRNNWTAEAVAALRLIKDLISDFTPNIFVDGEPLLVIAIENNNEELVRALLVAGAVVNDYRYYTQVTRQIYMKGDSPLILAIKIENIGIVKDLLEYGANLVGQGSSLNNTLVGAAVTGNLEIMKLLLAQPGANLETRGYHYATPLVAAIAWGKHTAENLTLIHYLLQQGARTDVKSSTFSLSKNVKMLFTPLIAAMDWGGLLRLLLVKMLLRYNPDLTLTDGNGRTALNIARQRGYNDVAREILRYQGETILEEGEGKD